MNKEFLIKKEELDHRLSTIIGDFLTKENPLAEIMAYGISAPGKRIRGVLTMVFCERLGVSEEQAIPFAESLELIHAYSLIHDDMPEMDNDDYRRGLLTCHKKFGPAMALLAGDGVLNFSLEHLLSKRKLYQPDRFMNALDALYEAAGARGMLYGQALDMMGETRILSIDELLELHQNKTGKLLLAPILIAQALAGNRNENYVNYCKHIGLAFQVKDDILDVEGSKELLGKDTGKDLVENKSTFVSLLGLEGAKEYLNKELIAAEVAAGDDTFLIWLAKYIGQREN